MLVLVVMAIVVVAVVVLRRDEGLSPPTMGESPGGWSSGGWGGIRCGTRTRTASIRASKGPLILGET